MARKGAAAAVEEKLLGRSGDALRPGPLNRFLKSLERPTRQTPLHVVETTGRAIDVARRVSDPLSLARLLRARAHALRAASRYGDARLDYEEAVRLFRKLGNAPEAAVSRIGLIDTLMYLGDYPGAVQEAGRARDHFRRSGDSIRRARVETNLGNIHQRRDDPAEALRWYDRARRTFRRLGDEASFALVEFNRGTVLSTLGRLDEARDAFESARRVFAARRLSARTGQIDYNLAYLYFLENRLPEALEAMARVRSELDRLGDRRHVALCRMDEAEILLRLHLWEDAAVSARMGLSGFEGLGMNYESGRVTAFLGAAARRAGDLEAAEIHFREAANRFEKEGNPVWKAEVALSLSLLDLDRGRWDVALRWANAARNGFRSAEWSDGLGRACLMAAAARRGLGQAAVAAEYVEEGLREARRLRSPWLTAEAHELRGLLALDRGDRALARRSFRASIRELERLRVLLTGDDLRAGFLRDRDRPYLALAQTELAAGRPREAFAALERGRALALLDMIATLGSGRRAGRTVKKLERQAESILVRLSRHYHNATIVGESGRSRSAAAPAGPAGVSALESQASRLLSRLGRGGARGMFVPPVDEASIRAILSPEESLIAYFESDGRLHAFRLTAKEFRHFPDLADTAEIASLIEGLRFQWGRFRVDPSLPDRHADQLGRMAREDLKELHSRILAPVDPGTPRLVMVPTAGLRAVPFGALFDGDRYLAEGRAVSVCPSSAVFKSCREARAPRSRRALLMGLADRLAPEVSGEIRDLKARFGKATVLTGRNATVQAFLNEAPRHDVVHLATHGMFRTERPNFSGVRLADRWLYGYDVARLELKARLVTIAACETGESVAWGHGEWLGLARSFLSAGASRVLVSLWEIDDEATRRLMRGFYDAWLGGVPASQALSRTQASMAAAGRHPYYWSGFSLLGDL